MRDDIAALRCHKDSLIFNIGNIFSLQFTIFR